MIFRKICLIFILIFSSISATPSSSQFKQDKVNILIPELWAIKKPIQSGSLVLTHNNLPATINIIQHYFLEPVTANGLQEIRSASTYDGWMNILSRPGSKKEILSANAKDSHLAVYVRQELNDQLKLDEFLTAEYYYVVDTTYYILTIETTKQAWKGIQEEWKFFIQNFWIGNGKRPLFHTFDISFNDWVQVGNFNNMNYINASPSVQKQLELKWELSVTANQTQANIPIASLGNNLFMIIDNYLSKKDYETGKEIWGFPLNESIDSTYLSCINSLLFLKDNFSQNIFALSTYTGEIIYTISINNLLSRPVFTQDALYINDNGTIRKYSIGSGLLLWSHDFHEFKKGSLFISEYHLIGQISTNEFIALNPENGVLSWKTKPVSLLMHPTCTNKVLLAPIKERSYNKKLIAFDLKDGSIKWSFNKSILNFSFNHEISSTNDFSIISYSILNDNNETDHFLMRINNDTGEIDWEFPSALGYSRPLLSSYFIFSFNTISNTLMVVDSNTGKDIPHMSLVKPLAQFIPIKESILQFFVSDTKLHIQAFN